MSDLSFFTNEPERDLKTRFQKLISNSEHFDCLVGYFYISGFYLIYPALKETSNIRILIGISTNKQTFKLIDQSQNMGDLEVKNVIQERLINELSDSDDNSNIVSGVNAFIDWIKSGKLEIKVYPSRKLHAKLYIMTFPKNAVDRGRVITGSSNFSKSGLEGNLEFNVELKNISDYLFASEQFKKLWDDAIDVTEDYVETISEKTWLANVSPYHLYLKLLYEHFKTELSDTGDLHLKLLPEGYKELDYQKQAVLNAKRILQTYGGVFISDVVGLGKTYIASMLAGQLHGRNLVIAPPALIDSNNPGSWNNAFDDFGIQARFESLGKLDNLLNGRSDKFDLVIIDEAHGFRNETTQSYSKLAQICKNKKVILVTATPYNNSPSDILSLVKLFQKPKNSDIPGVTNLDKFFKDRKRDIHRLTRKDTPEEFLRATQNNAKLIREKVLKHLMVRRTRTDIKRYFSDDINQQGLKFPEVGKPIPLFYQLSESENNIFSETIRLISTGIEYSRYRPLSYLRDKKRVNAAELTAGKNLGKFMKILLVKRLESSFYAFRKSVDRFISYYENTINAYDKGYVYISKKHSSKVSELLANDDLVSIENLIDEDKVQEYKADDFKESFYKALQNDISILKRIKELWKGVKSDPKLETLMDRLITDKILINSHQIIFTESKETADYLFKNLNNKYPGEVIKFDGTSNKSDRDKVIANFDAKAFNASSEFRILITTEVLSEGVNLHRSNVVINYDIPWNPTKLMQRAGRVNRVGTEHDFIQVYNFFPSDQGNNEIELKLAAIAKIHAFLNLLGDDSELLTEGEPIDSHNLFEKLNSAESFEEEEEESELKYFKVIDDIRKNDVDLFNLIKKIPIKARSAKEKTNSHSVLSYLRKGELKKFFINSGAEAKELIFTDAIKIFQSKPEDSSGRINDDFYFKCLDINKKAFDNSTEDDTSIELGNNNSNSRKLIKLINGLQQTSLGTTEIIDSYFDVLKESLEEELIPAKILKDIFHEFKSLNVDLSPELAYQILDQMIDKNFLVDNSPDKSEEESQKRQVVLSLINS